MKCQRCGQPMFIGVVDGVSYSVPQCLCFVQFKPAPNAADAGCREVRPLTEADVRRIVREELAAREAGTTAGN